jgi:transcriptional regulator with XRE-family HTH domain
VFGRRIAEVREHRGWTQKQLAERVSMRRETITMIESGKRRVTIDEWLAIAAALNAPPLHLIVSMDDEAMGTIGKEVHVATRLRAWIRGRMPLRVGDTRETMDWLAEWPSSELEEYIGRPPPGTNQVVAALANTEKRREQLADIVWEIKEGERIRRNEEQARRKRAGKDNDG